MADTLMLQYDLGEPVTLRACPPGLFLFDGSVGFKSEYGAMETVGPTNVPGPEVRWTVGNNPDAYCADSGEYFWGDAKSRAELNDLMVRPMYPQEPA